MFPRHLIGTQPFFSALLSYIHNIAAALPLDHVIFQSILLCLIAGDKHLILRTPEEDVGLVVKLAVWTLSAIFNLPTHKLKIKSRSSTITASVDTSVFLRSLFLPTSSQAESSADNAGLRSARHATHSRPLTKHKKSRSLTNNLVAAAYTQEPLLMSGSVPIHPSTSHSILRPRPVYPNESLPYSHSDPLPARRQKPLQLPQALVISGLEHATNLTQRTFARVLDERTVILDGRQGKVAEGTNNRKSGTSEVDLNGGGTWNLPDGFITVYVCPLDARERPPIHKILLDRFAMSSNIFVAQGIRHDFRALPFTPTPRPSHPHFSSHSNPGSPSPSHPMTLPQTHTPPTFTKPLPLRPRSSSYFKPPPLPENILPPFFLKDLSDAYHKTHISHTLSLYLADIFSATRHNSRVDATLLTARATKDAEALIRASRVIGTDLTGMELLRPMVQADDLSDTDSQKMATYEGSVSLHSVSGNAQASRHDVLDVSEVDVARIAPRVISHRVRVRDGPEDEILSSALFGATFKPHIATSIHELTVKGVLVQILSEV